MGDGFGWGVVGTRLAEAFAHRHPPGELRLIPATAAADLRDGPSAGPLAGVHDPLTRHALAPYLATAQGPAAPAPAPAAGGETSASAGEHGSRPVPVDGPVLHAAAGNGLHPVGPPLRSSPPHPTLAYAVFEDVLHPGAAATARRHYDRVVAPSRWCAERLAEVGVEDPAVVLHGVDPRLFHPGGATKRLQADRFVVFSGGKAEMRKGQDLVIRAFAVLAERHDDVLLVASWYNPWGWSLATLGACPGFEYSLPAGEKLEWGQAVRGLLAANGVDPERSVVLPPMGQAAMAAVYKESDVGLFPNRCEGASNLVLMEYMACGKPAIATDWAGHREVVTAENSVPLRRLRPLEVHNAAGEVTGRWVEPDLEEVVEALEWAYDHRDELAALGLRAGEDLAALTWQGAADAFDQLLQA